VSILYLCSRNGLSIKRAATEPPKDASSEEDDDEGRHIPEIESLAVPLRRRFSDSSDEGKKEEAPDWAERAVARQRSAEGQHGEEDSRAQPEDALPVEAEAAEEAKEEEEASPWDPDYEDSVFNSTVAGSMFHGQSLRLTGRWRQRESPGGGGAIRPRGRRSSRPRSPGGRGRRWGLLPRPRRPAPRRRRGLHLRKCRRGRQRRGSGGLRELPARRRRRSVAARRAATGAVPRRAQASDVLPSVPRGRRRRRRRRTDDDVWVEGVHGERVGERREERRRREHVGLQEGMGQAERERRRRVLWRGRERWVPGVRPRRAAQPEQRRGRRRLPQRSRRRGGRVRGRGGS